MAGNNDPQVAALDASIDDDHPAHELLQPFAHFDPLSGQVPDDWPPIYGEMVDRARALIHDWTPHDVERVAYLWQYLFERLHQAGFDEAQNAAHSSGQVPTYRSPDSTVQAVAARWGDLKVADLVDLPKKSNLHSWPQLYACLTLTRVAMRCHALRVPHSPLNLPQPLVELGWERNDTRHAARTMEALAYAEQEQRTLDAKRRKAQRAARARHASTNKLRLQVAQWFSTLNTETPGITAVKAAAIIEAEHREEIRATLRNNQDPAELIELWIGEYRRTPQDFLDKARAR